MSGVVDPIEILRARAQRLVAKGMSDQEIDRDIMYIDHEDRLIVWHLVNELRAEVATGRKSDRDDVSSEDVRAERARRMDAGEPYGYDALARHFLVSEATIRRRLGVL